MRLLLFCVLVAITLHITHAQQTTPESMGEVKPEIVFQDGSTFKYDTEFRTWSDVSGNFLVVARFDRFLPNEMVRLRREQSNSRIDVKIETLAPDDRVLLDRVSKQIDAVLVDKEKRAAIAAVTAGWEELTAGWEEAVSQRHKYLSEMHEVYANDVLSNVDKQIEYIAISKRWEKAPPVRVSVVSIVKEINYRVNGGMGGGIGSSVHGVRILKGVRAVESALVSSLSPDYSQRFPYRLVGPLTNSTQKFHNENLEKEVSEKSPCSEGDFFAGMFFIKPVSNNRKGSRGIDDFHPVKGLARSKTREDLAGCKDVKFWHIESDKTGRGQVLTPEQKEMLPRLQKFFNELQQEYGVVE